MPQTKPSSEPGPRGLGLLLVVILGAHLWFLFAGPRGKLWGDELSYAQHASRDAKLGTTSLLPGRLPFRTQPELAARLFASLGQGPGRLRAVGAFHIVLLALILAATYGQARLLGLGGRGAVLAVALLGTFPWFGFHVHSLWPEILHAFLFSIVLLCLLGAVARDRPFLLVPAGIAAGFALLTKGVLQPFLPVFALVAAVGTWRREGAAARAARWWHAVRDAAFFLLSVLAVVGPQLVANHSAGHGYHLAANRWWNLELGLTADPAAGRSVNRLSRAYFAASSDDIEREELARRRTLRYVKDTGLLPVAAAQLRKLARLLFERESSLERSLGKMDRWGPDPPWWLAKLRLPARVMWYGLLSLGAVGLVLFRRRGPGWVLVGTFTLLFFSAAAAVPLKVRFLIPVVPVLCLYAAGVLERLARGALAAPEPRSGPGSR